MRGGGENFLKKVFSPEPPLSKTFKEGNIYVVVWLGLSYALNQVREESFRPPFSKGGAVKGAQPLLKR